METLGGGITRSSHPPFLRMETGMLGSDYPYLSLAFHQLGSDISTMVYCSSFFSSKSCGIVGEKLYSAVTVMPTEGPWGSGGCGGKLQLGFS